MRKFLQNVLMVLVAATLLTGCGRTKLLEAQADEGLGLGKDEFIALYNRLIVKELAGNAEKIGELSAPSVSEYDDYYDAHFVLHPYRMTCTHFELKNEWGLTVIEYEDAMTIAEIHMNGPAKVGMPYIRALLNCLALSEEDRGQVEQSIESLYAGTDKGFIAEDRGGFHLYFSIDGKVPKAVERKIVFTLSAAYGGDSGRDIDQSSRGN